MKNTLWFHRKSYGWGWTPATWQGWGVLVLWGVIFAFALLGIESNFWLSQITIFTSTFILLGISYAKGETPRWQWGKKKGKF